MYIRNSIKILAVMVIAWIISGCAQSQNGAAGQPSSAPGSASIDRQILQTVNKLRSQPQYCAPATGPVRWSSSLKAAAYEHSEDMAKNHYVEHDGSGTQWDKTAIAKKLGRGSIFYERIRYNGFNIKAYALAGENATRITTRSGLRSWRTAIKYWMNDRKHCENIMNPRYTHVGMAGYIGDDGKVYWTMNLAEQK